MNLCWPVGFATQAITDAHCREIARRGKWHHASQSHPLIAAQPCTAVDKRDDWQRLAESLAGHQQIERLARVVRPRVGHVGDQLDGGRNPRWHALRCLPAHLCWSSDR